MPNAQCQSPEAKVRASFPRGAITLLPGAQRTGPIGDSRPNGGCHADPLRYDYCSVATLPEHTMRTTACLVFLLSATATEAFAQDAHITVAVVDGLGFPLVGTRIQVSLKASGTVVASLLTDAFGLGNDPSGAVPNLHIACNARGLPAIGTE